jgi:thiosulfate dehydrogenase [quinone] large subunit
MIDGKEKFMESTKSSQMDEHTISGLSDSPIAHFLFGDLRLSWIWLILRVYIGYEWLSAGWEKLHSPAWVGGSAGSALAGFVKGALAETSGSHPAVQGWYAAFLRDIVLPNVGIWGYAISIGESLVGAALILGLFTGIAAFFGSFMNFNYLLSGAVSINPILFVIATWLVLAWKTAGWIGLDHWVLPALGAPWSPGFIFKHKEVVNQTSRTTGRSHA